VTVEYSMTLVVVCPVCLRRTKAHGSQHVLFSRHRDGTGRVCVMSGRTSTLEAVTV